MELNIARRNTVLFVTVSLVAGFGGTAMILTSGIWVMDLTGDPGLAALAPACVYLPSLAGPLLGALADRFSRRSLLVHTCLITAAALLTLLAVRGPGHLWLICAVMLGYGAALTIVDAAEAALLPAALPAATLGTVNGLRMSAQEGVKLLAPLAGATLFTLAGAPPVIALSATLLATSALLYASLHLPKSGHAPPAAQASPAAQIAPAAQIVPAAGASTAAQVAPAAQASSGARTLPADWPRGARPVGDRVGLGAEPASGGASPGGDRVAAGSTRSGQAAGWWSSWAVGAGHLRRQPGLGAIVLVAAVGMGAAGLASGVLYAMIDNGLGRSPAFAGVLSAAQGGGAIAGGLAAGRIMASTGRRMTGEMLLAAVGAIVLAAGLVLRAVPWLPAVLAGSLLTGIGLPWAVVAAFTAIQRATPESSLGRVSATANSLIFAAPAVATPAGAVLLQVSGYRPVLLGAAALSLTAGLALTRAQCHSA
ncbi:MFS transporter [Catenuloplanes sp. NPDC051500]|uniref:MFS transporter n=1 Tax=Catenuloplanes sp. NPDC051500 TaxID=3363959 RepID=UPI0037AB09EF